MALALAGGRVGPILLDVGESMDWLGDSIVGSPAHAGTRAYAAATGLPQRMVVGMSATMIYGGSVAKKQSFPARRAASPVHRWMSVLETLTPGRTAEDWRGVRAARVRRAEGERR